MRSWAAVASSGGASPGHRQGGGDIRHDPHELNSPPPGSVDGLLREAAKSRADVTGARRATPTTCHNGVGAHVSAGGGRAACAGSPPRLRRMTQASGGAWPAGARSGTSSAWRST